MYCNFLRFRKEKKVTNLNPALLVTDDIRKLWSVEAEAINLQGMSGRVGNLTASTIYFICFTLIKYCTIQTNKTKIRKDSVFIKPTHNTFFKVLFQFTVFLSNAFLNKFHTINCPIGINAATVVFNFSCLY